MASTGEAWNSARLAFYDNRPEARLTSTSGVSIPNNSLASVALNSSTLDNWLGHNGSINPSRYTVQVAGVYQLSAQLSFTANSTGYRLLALGQNGTEVANSRFYSALAPSGIITTVSLPATLLRASAGDYLELWAFQNCGSALTTGDGNGNSGIQFNLVFQSF